MIHLIRTALSRDLGGMTNPSLYKRAHVGTKDLIDQYITTASGTLTTLLDIAEKHDFDGRESKYILEQLLAARQAFGRSALLLSGGAAFGLNHIGVVKALMATRLMPRIISGSSAGSIISAVLCTHTDDEMPEILSNIGEADFAVFEAHEGGQTLLQRVTRFLKFGSLFDISHLTRVMRNLLGDMTFQEAYNRTRRILNICVSNAGLYELPRLLNYITAPNVLIWSAV
jgi:TAG lipase/steryl ester hydrolase/phospholipase A2/LPA acyltransferase